MPTQFYPCAQYRTQGFVHAGQALYQLGYIPNPSKGLQRSSPWKYIVYSFLSGPFSQVIAHNLFYLGQKSLNAIFLISYVLNNYFPCLGLSLPSLLRHCAICLFTGHQAPYLGIEGTTHVFTFQCPLVTKTHTSLWAWRNSHPDSLCLRQQIKGEVRS